MTNPGGKGSAPRPFSVDQDTYSSNWDRIFRPGRTHRIDPDRKDEYDSGLDDVDAPDEEEDDV